MECPGWFLHLWLCGMKAHVKHLQWRRHESQRTEYKPSLVAIPSLLRVLVAQNFYSHARSSVLRRRSPETPVIFHAAPWWIVGDADRRPTVSNLEYRKERR